MQRLVPITAAKIMKILRRLGFEEIRVKGSHHFFLHPISRKSTSIPVHGGEILGIGILKEILRDIELPVEEYDRLRRGK